MGLTRRALLWASQNETLRERLPRLRMVKGAVRRFMPGESLEDALGAARAFAERGLPTTITHLGENVRTLDEAEAVTEHYLGAFARIGGDGLDTEVSVKLTHLGFDVDRARTAENARRLARRAEELGNRLWIDMEASAYVEGTVAAYMALREDFPTVGLCLQAYLHRTDADLDALLPLGASVRLVKGAYREPPEVAVQRGQEIDERYERMALRSLGPIRERDGRLAVATHDTDLIGRIDREAKAVGFDRDAYEVQMLYGIRQADQFDLLAQGFRVRSLIAYGQYWYPWYMRRLAEKPSNVLFVMRNVFSRAPSS
jgi:proline dehydrogenase